MDLGDVLVLRRRAARHDRGGRYGDLIVLNKDCFRVPDQELKQLQSILTVIGGKVVQDAGVL